MAVLLVLSAVAAIVLYHLVSSYRSLARNIALAKSSGLRVVVMPWNVHGVLWLATNPIWLPILGKLPASCKGLWFDLLDPEWAYRLGYKPFAELGTDVFMVACPSRISAFVADAEVVTQITTRRNDFPKPLHMYSRLNIYGRNLVATEGSEWRMHRKLTAPSFGEKNNELVFLESLHHAQCLMRLWTGPGGREEKTINDPATDTMRFALYVISRAGFGVRVAWPHEEEEEKQAEEQITGADSIFGSKVPPGHKMNYREALGSLLHNIMWTQMGPPEYLTKSPFKIHRTVGTAVIEWGKYMDELFEGKKAEIASGHSTEGMDLFGTLIRGSGILDEKTTDLQKSDILGNAFIIMLAGHETTANVIHFSLLYLAMNWASQKRLHEDIDKNLGGKPIKDWSYDEDFPRLFSGMPAAVMNETLRLLQPIINIPKSTAPGRPQEFSMGGQQYTLPGGTEVSLCAAIHRNPKYWPAPTNYKSTDGLADTDRFRPERWLIEEKPTEDFEDINYDDEDLRGPSGEDTSAQLFKPVKGSYIPFSDGYRSCIGRRFAQVEVLAVFAVIFSQYSVELAVDEFASDAEVEKMPAGGEQRKEIWKKAADRADHLLTKTMGSIITLQLRGDTIPIRFVRRGRERFLFE
ncbi:cytochrome P450 monooxygenase-like protein [Melanomma pulvis-pyrius CBS 109.77]|uniref:Cytochrome P450 monooxygenase-like protein n=1 Tax=Melanomma pulvis-pyrius CBS 109.77 TaxID=1314802 RepID=A0A6A6XGT2_9PLEO|nr:cytochrome P450 monooxygenase-like protein [Melanomma pulvis-pyrius CBS 109.77]